MIPSGSSLISFWSWAPVILPTVSRTLPILVPGLIPQDSTWPSKFRLEVAGVECGVELTVAVPPAGAVPPASPPVVPVPGGLVDPVPNKLPLGVEPPSPVPVVVKPSPPSMNLGRTARPASLTAPGETEIKVSSHKTLCCRCQVCIELERN